MSRHGIARGAMRGVVSVAVVSGMVGVSAGAAGATGEPAPRAAWRVSPARLSDAIRLPADPTDGVTLDPRVVMKGGDYFVAVVTEAVPVMRDGVRYWFNLEIWQPGKGATPLVDVFLFKGYGHGASQFFDYEFQTDRPFEFDRSRLSYQHYDGGGRELGASRVSETFSPTAPRTGHPCELADGSTGRYKERPGVLSYRKLSIDTGTAPFFGTITEQPTVATLIFDPLCGSGGNRPHRPCPSAVSLGAIGTDPNGGPILYADGPGPAQAGTLEVILDAVTIWHAGWPENVLFIGSAPTPDGDLPPPTWDQQGASGSLSTDGFAFGSGAGTFTSKRKPEVHRDLTCRAHGVKHVYTSYHYKGRFVANPRFVDHFVTGDHRIPPRSQGDLYIADYVS